METPEQIMRAALVRVAELTAGGECDANEVWDVAVKAISQADARATALAFETVRVGTAFRAGLVARLTRPGR
ncbi:MAG: hypothetical protein ABIJ95_07095 [Pseudomonadota bacterium]